jgi:hypothetical protein
VRVAHDLAFFNLAVFLEKTGNFGFAQLRMNSRDEEVGAGVDGSIIISALGTRVILSAASEMNVSLRIAIRKSG